MIVTIDGGAGSGKSTVARELATRLQIAYLDTGAMYRGIAHAALQRGIDLADEDALLATARSTHLDLDCGPACTRLRVDGQDVSDAIRTMAVSAATSYVARAQSIREHLIEQQRQLGEKLGSFVSEGRDQGSVVFPNADFKFVLEASPRKRAERRHQELLAAGDEGPVIADVLDDLQARDRVDARQWEPLLSTAEAVVVDTTHMTIQQVVDRIVEVIGARPTQV